MVARRIRDNDENNAKHRFQLAMKTMQNIVFSWPDETEFYPGHGPSGMIGVERSAFEAFLERGWSEDLQGDVTWSQ
jgi:glyoxylase-like metal-dependent hydrolase (beta-lactamase superfamily II)